MIKIICVGKLKEKYLKDAVLEYQKRLSKYVKCVLIEVPDYGMLPEEKAMFQEAEEITKYIDAKDYVITLEVDGETINSVSFSSKLDKLFFNFSTITFIIGGSNGIHPMIKKRSNYALSFSKFTFPHQLFRVMLLEQIYRAFKIKNNESYHK